MYEFSIFTLFLIGVTPKYTLIKSSELRHDLLLKPNGNKTQQIHIKFKPLGVVYLK